MFNYEVTSVPCTSPSYLSFLPASFQPLRCPRTSPGARFIDSHFLCVSYELFRIRFPRFTIFTRNYLSGGGGHGADRNFCFPLTILPCNIKYVILDETRNIPSQKRTMKTADKYEKSINAKASQVLDSIITKHVVKNILQNTAYKSEKKKKEKEIKKT